MTTLKEALRLTGNTDERQIVHIVPYGKDSFTYGQVLSVKNVREKFDLKRTYVHSIDYICFREDGEFLYWEFVVFNRKEN